MRLLRTYDALPTPAKAAVWFAVCSAVQSGASFLAIPFLTRLMSQEQYGIVTLYNSWRQIVIIFATLNVYAGVFNVGMTKWKDERDRYLSSMIGLTLVLVLIAAAVYLVFRNPLDALFQLDTPFMLIMFVQIFASTVFSLWSARERFEYRYKALLLVTFAYAFIGQAVSVLCTWSVQDDASKALVSVLSLSIALMVLALFIVGDACRKGRAFIDMRFWKHAVLFNLPLVPHYLATLILGQANRIMIASMNGKAEAAIYGVAYTVGLMIQIVTGAISNAMIPWLFGKLSKREPAGVSRLIELSTLGVGALNLLVVLAAPEIMSIVGPESYQEGIYVIPPVAASMLMTFVYGFFANIELFYEKKFGVALASVCAAVANVGLNLWALPRFGYLSAGYTMLTCYTLLALGHYLYARRAARVGRVPGLLNGLRIFACCIAFVPIGALAVCLYPFPLVRLALCVVLAFVFYCKRSQIATLMRHVRERPASTDAS